MEVSSSEGCWREGLLGEILLRAGWAMVAVDEVGCQSQWQEVTMVEGAGEGCGQGIAQSRNSRAWRRPNWELGLQVLAALLCCPLA